MLVSIAVLGLGFAHAQTWETEQTSNERETARRAGTQVVDLPVRRTYRYETNFRARYLSVPDSILDIWFFNNDADGANHTHDQKSGRIRRAQNLF